MRSTVTPALSLGEGEGVSAGLVAAARRRAHPASVHRMVRADELQEGGAPLGVLVEGAAEGGNDLRGLRDVLGVEPERLGHVGHARRVVRRYLVRVRIVARTPEAGA